MSEEEKLARKKCYCAGMADGILWLLYNHQQVIGPMLNDIEDDDLTHLFELITKAGEMFGNMSAGDPETYMEKAGKGDNARLTSLTYGRQSIIRLKH